MSKRLDSLIEKIESGQPVTQQDADQAATLIALDTVKSGQQYLEEAVQRQQEHDEQVARLLQGSSAD